MYGYKSIEMYMIKWEEHESKILVKEEDIENQLLFQQCQESYLHSKIQLSQSRREWNFHPTNSANSAKVHHSGIT